jgi:hypothetical protein
MSKSLRLGVALALVLTVAGVVGYVAARHGADKQERSHEAAPAIAAKQSEAQLAGANYKVLTPGKTRRLLRYADAAYACLSKELDIGKPRSLQTKIVIALPAGVTPAAVAQLSLKCAATIGDPPKDSSFQVRGEAVILYLPKYCLLDPKVDRAKAGR